MNFSADYQKSSTAITVQKENGTLVDYYLRQNFEVHFNTLPKKLTQEWHAHQYLQEIVFVLTGGLAVEIFERNQTIKRIELAPHDLITMNNSLHRVINPFEEACQFIVFRFIPGPADYGRDITKDKLWFSDEEIAKLSQPSFKLEELQESEKKHYLKTLFQS
ncbi:cupin domain-containing protein [Enterococcus sp. LJL90]